MNSNWNIDHIDAIPAAGMRARISIRFLVPGTASVDMQDTHGVGASVHSPNPLDWVDPNPNAAVSIYPINPPNVPLATQVSPNVWVITYPPIGPDVVVITVMDM